MRGCVSILWHSLRKEGLSRPDVVAGKWKWSRPEVGEMFPGGDVEVVFPLVVELLKASGFKCETRPTMGPTDAEQSAPSTGAASLSAPSPTAVLPSTT